VSCSCPSPVDGFAFPEDQIVAARERHGLLSMEIEFSLVCNFRCVYCYNDGEPDEPPLTSSEIDDVLQQAKALGARKIVVLGGEPMLYPEIKQKLLTVRELGLDVEMFTNGSHMTPENARFMFDHDIAVVLKMNTLDAGLQNRLAGHKDAHRIISAAAENLAAAGYPSPGKRLAYSTVICEPNLEELPDLWRSLRRRGIEPYFEMITPQGRANESDWLFVSSERQRELFEELSRIDREEFGRRWEPQPPLAGNRCLRHQFSCLVNSRGIVMPCVGVTIPLGSVREEPLRDILDKSEVMENLRDFPNRIKSPCSACGKVRVCYGCRGAAYQLTGDYLAADPLCWHNQGKSIERLPADVTPYVPHRRPMLMVDKLLSIGERCARLRATVTPDNLFTDENGLLDDTIYVELVAQAIAALHGFHQPARERDDHRGFLLGAKNFVVSGEAHAGDVLEIDLRKVGRLGDFGVVAGTIYRGDVETAHGEVTVWQTSEGTESS